MVVFSFRCFSWHLPESKSRLLTIGGDQRRADGVCSQQDAINYSSVCPHPFVLTALVQAPPTALSATASGPSQVNSLLKYTVMNPLFEAAFGNHVDIPAQHFTQVH